MPNISQSKGNQTIKYAQLIEYNVWNVFLVHQNVLEELFPDPFLKNLNWAYFWINGLKFCFYYMPSSELLKYIETKLQTTCFISYHFTISHRKTSNFDMCLFIKIIKIKIIKIIFIKIHLYLSLLFYTKDYLSFKKDLSWF